MPARRFDLQGVLRGDRVAVSRAISEVENDPSRAESMLREIFPRTGRAHRIGVTGPPGAGKSTLTNKLAALFRRDGQSVGIIAVDPTSPFTGGAVLGDRVRMSEIELDAGVFIRSMASRGSLGGLSRCATEAADVLDAAGKEIILLETVGVGQSELDIARAADTTIVVLVPESGDAIQAMKAGLMEIADMFVMNKADRAGADSAVQSLQTILGLRHGAGPTPEVFTCVAQEGRGVAELAAAVRVHRIALEQSGALRSRRHARLEERIADLIVGRVRRQFWTPERRAALARRTTEVLRGAGTPYDVVEELTQSFRLSNDE